ncbi:MAG: hypothetical protein GYB66_04305 [Chloroflexi bacterium]|nr:hypothetical protein [Chloroflexota bacterium]
MDVINFAFVRTVDMVALKDAILLINRSRHYPVSYSRVIQTTPRSGWIALIMDSMTPDHYLMRNISGRLETTAFELGINGEALYYRYHHDGRTEAAYESNLSKWIAQQLRLVLNSGDVRRIDLSEPGGRLVLQRYHEYQRSRSWTQPASDEEIDPSIRESYRPDATSLQELIEPNADIDDVQAILESDMTAQEMLGGLIDLLALPYLKGDPVMVAVGNEITQPIQDDMISMNTKDLSRSLQGHRVVNALAVLQPSTWLEGNPLPDGWLTLTQNNWAST